jgi:hypothetical protein
MDFAPFEMAHTPLKMTIKEARQEVDRAWSFSYSPERNASALDEIRESPLQYRISHLVARLFFRGIYFPQMGKRAWLKLIAQNRRPIWRLVRESFGTYWASRRKEPEMLGEGTHAPAID